MHESLKYKEEANKSSKQYFIFKINYCWLRWGLDSAVMLDSRIFVHLGRPITLKNVMQLLFCLVLCKKILYADGKDTADVCYWSLLFAVKLIWKPDFVLFILFILR